MALFDLAPKGSARAIYGREAEVQTIVRLVGQGRWTVLLRPRMVGKTGPYTLAVGAAGAGWSDSYGTPTCLAFCRRHPATRWPVGGRY